MIFYDFIHTTTLLQITILLSETSNIIFFLSFQGATPIRIHSMLFVNVAGFRFTIMEFVKSLMSEKVKSRIEVHKDDAILITKLNTKNLPREYGGSVPLQDMINNFKNYINTMQPYILSLEQLQIIVTKSNSVLDEPGTNSTTGTFGSFRKLEVD